MTVPDALEPDVLDISPNKDGGLLKTVIKKGESGGIPESGDEVFVNYTGTLQDGTVFDSNKDRGDPFSFTLGKGMVIKGWEIGVSTMQKGEIASLTCSPEFAYGDSGAPPRIPPNATLNFEVELLYWKGEDLSPNEDGGIIRHFISRGEGHQNPNTGASIEIHIVGKYKDAVFEDRDVSYTVGDGDEAGVCPGIDIAVSKCKAGDVVRLDISSKYGFGAEGKPEYNIPPNANIQYTLTVKKFESAKEAWELNVFEKISQSFILKDKGTVFFKKANYELAVEKYKKIVDYLQNETASMSDDQQNDRTKLLLAAHLNLCACYLKLNDYVKAREDADKALLYDKENEKALFRRGQALLKLQEPAEAKKDFQSVLHINPDNKAAASQIAECIGVIKKQKDRDKKLYANMFDKFAKIDKQKEDANIAKQPDCLSNPGEWDNETPEILSSDGIDLKQKMKPEEIQEWDRECESEEDDKSEDKEAA